MIDLTSRVDNASFQDAYGASKDAIEQVGGSVQDRAAFVVSVGLSHTLFPPLAFYSRSSLRPTTSLWKA